jgi:hypothetical protein
MQALMALLGGLKTNAAPTAAPQSAIAPMGGVMAQPTAAASPQPVYGRESFGFEYPDVTPDKDKDKSKDKKPKVLTPLQKYKIKQREDIKAAVDYGPTAYNKVMQQNLGMNEPTVGYGAAAPTSKSFSEQFTDLFTGTPKPRARRNPRNI